MGVKENLAVGLAFTVAAMGTGLAAAEPVQAVKPAASQPAKSIVDDFNNHSKAAVFYRNLDRDVSREPLLIKQENGRYLVHESSGLLGPLTSDGAGVLKSYNKEELVNEHGSLDKIRTYDQFKADSEVLSKTPGLGRNLSENSDFMGFRLKEIQADMKAAGESFAQSGPKNIPGFGQ